MNKENRKAARERRAKEREHEAKVAHYKKIWSWAGPALIVVVIVGLIIASVLDSKRLSANEAVEVSFFKFTLYHCTNIITSFMTDMTE